MIARKIAVAQAPAPVSDDASEVAQPLLQDLSQALSEWLGVEEAETALRSAGRKSPALDALPEFIILCRGSRRNRLVAIGVSRPLAEMATRTMLGIEAALDDPALNALRPFMAQNLLTLGHRYNDSDLMELAGKDSPEWTIETADVVETEFSRHDVLTLELDILDGDSGDIRVTLMATTAMIPDAEVDVDDKVIAPRLSPRLGPCHVNVRAVADRVRMSVADCTRLEIGQVVALPGLRFDQLELSVDMDDGPLALTDAALGADKGMKAVRLNRGLDPAFHAVPSTGSFPTDTSPTGSAPSAHTPDPIVPPAPTAQPLLSPAQSTGVPA